MEHGPSRTQRIAGCGHLRGDGNPSDWRTATGVIGGSLRRLRLPCCEIAVSAAAVGFIIRRRPVRIPGREGFRPDVRRRHGQAAARCAAAASQPSHASLVHDFLLFRRGHVVDFALVLLCEILDLILRRLAEILGENFVLHAGVRVFVGVAADVAD
jgi:hypothetical protein